MSQDHQPSRPTNIYPGHGTITSTQRSDQLGHSPLTVWFTGLSGSGKSTIAVALEQALYDMRKLSYRLDGDNVRLGINKNLGFSEQDRKENIRRVAEAAKLFSENGVIVFVSV